MKLTLEPFTRTNDDGDVRRLWRCEVETADGISAWESARLAGALMTGVQLIAALEAEAHGRQSEVEAGTAGDGEREGVPATEDAGPTQDAPAGNGRPALRLLGADGDELEPEVSAPVAGNGQSTPDRDPDKSRRSVAARAACERLVLTIVQSAAVMQAALDLPMIEEQTGAIEKDGEMYVACLVLACHEAMLNGRPFWYAVASARHKVTDKPAKMAGDTELAQARKGRASALASHLMANTGEWEDTVWLAKDGKVLHRARPLHDDELRHLHGALPVADKGVFSNEMDDAWKEHPRNHRSSIQVVDAGAKPPEPEQDKHPR